MKNLYIRTNWTDNKTPVNAANLNNIEKGISDLYSSAISPSEIVAGDGIEIGTTSEKELEISVDESVVRSASVTKVEWRTEGDVASYEDGAVYFVLSPETGKLSKIVVNNVVVYEVE